MSGYEYSPTGTDGDDLVVGTTGNNSLDGGANSDVVLGDAGNDTITGGGNRRFGHPGRPLQFDPECGLRRRRPCSRQYPDDEARRRLQVHRDEVCTAAPAIHELHYGLL